MEMWSKLFSKELVVTKYIVKFSLIHLYYFFNNLTTNSESPFILTSLPLSPIKSKVTLSRLHIQPHCLNKDL